MLFKVKNSNDLIKKIFALIKNKSLRKELSQNCYKLAKDKFGVEKVLKFMKQFTQDKKLLFVELNEINFYALKNYIKSII